jgi:hypothetical protein
MIQVHNIYIYIFYMSSQEEERWFELVAPSQLSYPFGTISTQPCMLVRIRRNKIITLKYVRHMAWNNNSLLCG